MHTSQAFNDGYDHHVNTMNFAPIITSVAFIAGAGYVISIGTLMTINPNYRKYVTNVWFKIDNEQEQHLHQWSTKYIAGPMYIIFGIAFIALGLQFLGILPPF